MAKGQNTSGAELRLTVHRLSNEAFSLAKDLSARPDRTEELQGKAREINSRLDELWPQIQAAPASDRQGMSQAWSDARLEMGYVLSGGQLSTSTRLHAYLEEQKRQG